MDEIGIDLRGVWSPAQARAIERTFGSAIQARGLTLAWLDVTCAGGPQRWMAQVSWTPPPHSPATEVEVTAWVR